MCLDPDHPQQTTGRIKLLSTSSTLHHVQLSATYNEEMIAAHLDFLDSTFHVDIDQISGGRLYPFMEEVVLGATAAGGLRGCGRPERRRPSQCRPVCVQVEGVESNDGGALPVTRSRQPQHTGRRHAAVRPQVLLARGQHDRSLRRAGTARTSNCAG